MYKVIINYSIVFLCFTFLYGCKSASSKKASGSKIEIHAITEKYDNGKIKVEYIYPDIKNKSCYTIIEYFSNGNISFQGTVINDKFCGVKLNYFENGNYLSIDSLNQPCKLEECCCDGSVTHFFSNGKKQQLFHQKNGKFDGEIILYSDDSTGTKKERFFYKNEKRNGIDSSFYETGQVYTIEKYANDTLVDYSYFFEKNGDTIKYYNHYKGKIDFPYKKWLAGGKQLYGYYSGKRYDTVSWIWYDKNGKELKRKTVTKNSHKQFITPE